MVIVLEDQLALNPAGKPVDTPIPVAPVVLWVILINGEPMHKVGVVDAMPTVLAAATVIDPVALPPPQPPVNKML